MKTNIQTIISPHRPAGNHSYSHLSGSILVTASCSQHLRVSSLERKIEGQKEISSLKSDSPLVLNAHPL